MTQWSYKVAGVKKDLVTEGVIPQGKKVTAPSGPGYGLWYQTKPTVSFTLEGREAYRAAWAEKEFSALAIGKHIAQLEAGGSAMQLSWPVGSANVEFVHSAAADRGWGTPTTQNMRDIHEAVLGYAAYRGDDAERMTTQLFFERAEIGLRAMGIIQGDMISEHDYANVPALFNDNSTTIQSVGGSLGLFFLAYRGTSSSNTNAVAGNKARIYRRGPSSIGALGMRVTLPYLAALSTWRYTAEIFYPNTFNALTTNYPAYTRATTMVEVSLPVTNVTVNGVTNSQYTPGKLYDGVNYTTAPTLNTIAAPASTAYTWSATTATVLGSVEDYKSLMGMTDAQVLASFYEVGRKKGLLGFDGGWLLGCAGVNGMDYKFVVESTAAEEWKTLLYASRLSSVSLASALTEAAADVAEATPSPVSELIANPRVFHGVLVSASFYLMNNPLFATSIFAKANEAGKSLIPEVMIPADQDEFDSVDVTFGAANERANTLRTKFGPRVSLVLPGDATTSPFVKTAVHVDGRDGAGLLVLRDGPGGAVIDDAQALYSMSRGVTPTFTSTSVFESTPAPAGPYSVWFDALCLELYDRTYGSITKDPVSPNGKGGREWRVASALDADGFLRNPATWGAELYLLNGATNSFEASFTLGGLLANPFSLGLRAA